MEKINILAKASQHYNKACKLFFAILCKFILHTIFLCIVRLWWSGRRNSTVSVASFGRDYEYRSIDTICSLYIPTCFLELSE